MIRTTRVCLLGKNYFNFPLFTQRAVILPKQMFLEFSIVADKDEEPATQKQPKKEPQRHVSENPFEGLRESFGEIKYSFLRDLLQGGIQKNSDVVNVDTVITDFFNRLPGFTPTEIIKVLKLMVETNNRPILSIKALCGLLLSQQNWKYTPQECADLLYCLSKLSYRDPQIIRLIADNLMELDTYKSPKVAGFMLYNLADLRFRDTKLLDRLLNYIVTSDYTIRTSLHCLRAVSLLNFASEEVSEIIRNLGGLKETDFERSMDYIDFVWGCVILDKQEEISQEHIHAVLSEDFVMRVINSEFTGSNNLIKKKLLNINGATAQMLGYKGPTLNNLDYFNVMSIAIPQQRNPFLESVLDVLTHLVPKSGLLKPLVNTGAGFYLDFEYNPNVSKVNNKYSKTGILLYHFNDICSDGTLTGFCAFKRTLLFSMGYKVVDLRYSDYNLTAPLSQKIEFVRKKLEEAGVSCRNTVDEKPMKNKKWS